MDTMGDDLRSLLAELREHGREHDTRQERHDDRLRNLEPETAALLAVLVRSGRRRSLLDIGTSNGYSTVWLAWAAEATGG
jgi:predicted O-methyltransferase YrrM